MPATGNSTEAYEFGFDKPSHSTDLNAIQAVINADPAVQAAAADEAKLASSTTQVPGDQTPPAAEKVEAAQPSPAKETSQAGDIKTVTITVDGQELEVTEADLKAGHMRHRDYTQKSQAVAAEKRAIAEERAAWNQEKAAISQELGAIDQFLKDQQAMDAYYEKAFGVRRGEVIQPPQIDPNKPITAEEVAQISRYNAEQVRIHADRQIAEARQEALRAQQFIVNERAAASRAVAQTEIDRHLGALLDKYPVLKKFEDIAEDIYGDAARYMPTDRKGTIEEAKQRLSEAVERRITTIRSIAEEEKKSQAVAAATLKKHSTEAPGGAAPRPAEGRKLTLSARDRKDFQAAAEADLRAIMGQT